MIADILAGILSGIFGAMGFGGGGILILYLTLYRNINQLTAQGINLLFFIPSAAAAVAVHLKHHLIDLKKALKYTLFALIGVAAGYFLLKIINENMITKIFSVLLIIIGIRELFSNNKN